MERASAAQWARRVARWKDSGLTAKEFASETGLKASTLTYWKWRLGATQAAQPSAAEPVARREKAPAAASQASKRRSSRASRAKRASLVEVPLASVSASAQGVESPALELVVGGAVTVRVPRNFDEATLKRVVRALS